MTGGEADQGLDTLLVPGLEGEAAGLSVLVEKTHSAERFVASWAAVLLVLEVGLEVSPEVGFVSKVP